MMRTSNFFPLARRYSKQKARSRVQSTTNGGKALDRAFSFLLWGNQEKERKSVHFCSINAKGMLIFIVADIWNCYNMDMKKATNLKVLIIFKQPHCMEIRNRLSLK